MEIYTYKQAAEVNLSNLKTEWGKYFKIPPPAKSSRAFLLKNILWQKQAKEQNVNLKKFNKMILPLYL